MAVNPYASPTATAEATPADAPPRPPLSNRIAKRICQVGLAFIVAGIAASANRFGKSEGAAASEFGAIIFAFGALMWFVTRR